MNIPIKVSRKMSSAPKVDECKLIRIPQELRTLYQADVNQFVNIKSNEGKVVTLKIMPAYLEDAKNDPMVAYVCESVFSTLRIENLIQEQEIELVEGITLGCDPEFFLVDQQNRLVYGSAFFRRWGDVGTDGPMVEIRPLPSTSEHMVAENIFALINKARYIMNGRSGANAILNFGRYIDGALIRMVAKSAYLGEAAGFHLHYGLPKPLLGPHKVNRTLLAGQIVKALDFYVGIPSIILEGEQDSFRRSFVSSRYGKPGAFDLDNKTLEYRVPGGYLLRHPVLTKGLLGLGAVVIEDVISRIKAITDNYAHLEEMVASGDDIRIVYPNIPTAADIYKSIVATTTTFAERNMNIIMDDVRDMMGYNKRKDSIEEFFQCITLKREYSNLLEQNWRAYYNEERQGSVAVFPA